MSQSRLVSTKSEISWLVSCLDSSVLTPSLQVTSISNKHLSIKHDNCTNTRQLTISTKVTRQNSSQTNIFLQISWRAHTFCSWIH